MAVSSPKRKTSITPLKYTCIGTLIDCAKVSISRYTQWFGTSLGVLWCCKTCVTYP